MAQAKLMDGIASISGTISRKPNGTRVVARTYNGKTRIYVWGPDDGKRQTPPTQKELAHRERFAEASKQLNHMSEAELKQYAYEMKEAHYTFNGKSYRSLRGYILARLYAQLAQD